MLNKPYYLFIIAVFLTSLLFTGCSKPPIAIARGLNLDFKEVSLKGGQVFAPSEFTTMSKKINEMNNLMDRGKFKQAERIANSLIPEMNALKTKVNKNGQRSAEKGLANVTKKLNKASTLLAIENRKILSKQAFNDLIKSGSGFIARSSVLQEDLKNTQYLRVYNRSKILDGEISKSIDTFNKMINEKKKR